MTTALTVLIWVIAITLAAPIAFWMLVLLAAIVIAVIDWLE